MFYRVVNFGVSNFFIDFGNYNREYFINIFMEIIFLFIFLKYGREIFLLQVVMGKGRKGEVNFSIYLFVLGIVIDKFIYIIVYNFCNNFVIYYYVYCKDGEVED